MLQGARPVHAVQSLQDRFDGMGPGAAFGAIISFPWSLLQDNIPLHKISTGTQAGNWIGGQDLVVPPNLQSVFGSVMRRRDKSSHWLMMVATELTGRGSSMHDQSQAEALSDVEVFTAVLSQIAAHDLHGFNDLILIGLFDALVPIVNHSQVAGRHLPTFRKWLIGVSCVRVILDPSAGFVNQARRTPHYLSGRHDFVDHRDMICLTFLEAIEDILRSCNASQGSTMAGRKAHALQLCTLVDKAHLDTAWSALEEPDRRQTGQNVTGGDSIEELLFPGALMTFMHVIRIFSEDEQSSAGGRAAAVQTAATEVVNSIGELLWSLAIHPRLEIAEASCKLVIECIARQPAIRVSLLMAGVSQLLQLPMDNLAEQESLLATLIACFSAWARSVETLDIPLRVAAFASLGRDGDANRLMHAVDALCCNMMCSAHIPVRVLALHLADQVTSLHDLLLEPTLAHKASAAALRKEQWSPESCSDNGWGSAHCNVGTVIKAFGVSIVSDHAPQFAADFKSDFDFSPDTDQNSGALILGAVASHSEPSTWLSCLGSLGKAFVSHLCPHSVHRLCSNMLASVENLDPLPQSTSALSTRKALYTAQFFELWKAEHVLLFSICPDATELAAETHGASQQVSDTQRLDALSRYLHSRWDQLLMSELPEIRDAVSDVMSATKWNTVHVVVDSLLRWWSVKRVGLAQTNRVEEVDLAVFEVLRVMAQEETFMRSCANSESGLLRNYLHLIDPFHGVMPSIPFPRTSRGDFHMHKIHFYIDYVHVVIRTMNGLAQTSAAHALRHWPLKSRYAVFLQLQKWSGEHIDHAPDGVPIATWDRKHLDQIWLSLGDDSRTRQREVADWLQMLQHVSSVAVEAMLSCGPLFERDDTQALACTLDWALRIETRGYRVLRWILHHHYDQVIHLCVDLCYDGRRRSEIGIYAISCNLMELPVQPSTEQEGLSVQAKLSTRSMNWVLNCKSASDAILRDGKFAHRIHKSAPHVIFLSLVQLLSTSFAVRINAFDLLCHVVPFCSSLGDGQRDSLLSDHANPPDGGDFARFMARHRLSFTGDSPDSSAATLIAEEVARRCVILTERVFGEAFTRMSSNIEDNLDKLWLWRSLKPWTKAISLSASEQHGCLIYSSLKGVQDELQPEFLVTQFRDPNNFLNLLFGMSWNFGSHFSYCFPEEILDVWNGLVDNESGMGVTSAGEPHIQFGRSRVMHGLFLPLFSCD